MFRQLICIVTMLLLSVRGWAQVKSDCDSDCSHKSGACHLERAQLLLKGDVGDSSVCSQAFAKTLETMSREDRLRRSVLELDEAISAEDVLPSDLTMAKFDKAAVLVVLGGKQLSVGDPTGAEHRFSDAAAIYMGLLNASTVDAPSEQLSKIAVGLLRCGRPTQAFEAIDRLPSRSADREYLTAEALMVIGQRKLAASAYENWISGGCASRLSLLADDEFGERWVFLPLRTPRDQTKCEQMPSELRSRLSTLQTEYGHPDNIPQKSFPSEPFPARTQ